MRPTKRRTTRIVLRTSVVIALIVAATTAFLGPVTTINQSQQTTPGTSSKLSQQVVASRTASWSSLAVKWTQELWLSGSAIVVDIDGDGRPEVLANGDYDLYCLNGMGDVKWRSYTGGHGYGTLAVADIDGDGKMEIIAPRDYDYGFLCLDSTGARKWTDNSGQRFAYSSPTIADIDQDGRLEILIGSNNPYNQSDPHRLFCIDGSDRVKWSYAIGATISSSSTVADVQGDGKLEVLLTGSNKTYCLNASGASVWNFTSVGSAQFSPAVADVDGDGRKEVVLGWSDGSIYCLNASGILKWSYLTGYMNYLSYSSVADVDGDGRPEIIFSSMGKMIYCLDGSGNLKWSRPTDTSVYYPPTLANVDMDNDLEIVFGTGYDYLAPLNGGIVYCLNSSGATEWTYATGDAGIYSPPVVADIDLDGKPEVVVPGPDSIYCLTAFPAPQVLIPSSVAIILVGLASASITMIAVTMVRRNREVQTGSRRRRRGSGPRSRR